MLSRTFFKGYIFGINFKHIPVRIIRTITGVILGDNQDIILGRIVEAIHLGILRGALRYVFF